MRRLRLLAVIEARTITGPAKNLIEFARTGRDLGVETVVATFVRGEHSNLFLEAARASSIEVNPIVERGPFDPAVPRRLFQTVARVRPDLVQTHAPKSHFLARLSTLPRLARWVAFHHGYTSSGAKGRLYNALDRWSLRTAARVLTVSQAFATQLQTSGIPARRIDVIHNAIRVNGTSPSAEKAAALRAELGIVLDGNVILIVGRLSREKDHLTLLEALRLLSPGLKPHLLVVGDGPERLHIEARIRALRLENAVTLTGQQVSSDPYYGIAQVAVLSSRSEGSPNALLEAMAAGIPVVATAVGGIPEIVTSDESALLVRPGDAEGMAGAIQRLLRNPELAESLRSRALALVRERHTPEGRARKLFEIYSGVCRNPPTSGIMS